MEENLEINNEISDDNKSNSEEIKLTKSEKDITIELIDELFNFT